MVSKPLLWPFLSSLVFIGVTPLSTSLPPSQQSPQPLVVEPSTSSSHCLRVPDLLPLSLRSPTPHRSFHVSSHREYCSDHISGGIIEIVLNRSTLRWKPRSHQRPHAPSCAARSFCVSDSRATRVVLSSSWRHPWHHLLHVSPSCVSICHMMTSAPRHLGDVICWPLTVDFDRLLTDHWPLTSTGHWLWPLTFAVQVLLTQFFT